MCNFQQRSLSLRCRLGYALVYAVVQPLGYPRYPAPPRAQPDGLWLIRYDRGAPRLLASNAQLAVDGIGRLSFSADGRTLAVVASQGQRADNLAVDVATGRATPLLRTVDNVDDVQFSPVSPHLAYRATVYVPVPGQPNTVEADEAVYVADPQGRRRAMLTRTTLSTSIQSLAWSPDGRNVAYLWGGGPRQVLDDIRAVNVATRHLRTLVGAVLHRQFTDLAWMHCRARTA
jgi:dipeptidyl aminopeptidase/acylaminoacyl peptidase